MRALCAFFLLMYLSVSSYAAEGTHQDFHEFYKDLVNPMSGHSCCNDKDCRPVNARYDTEHRWWEVYIPEVKDWYPVFSGNILPTPSPDNQVHACYTVIPGRSVLDLDGKRDEDIDVHVRCLTLPGMA